MLKKICYYLLDKISPHIAPNLLYSNMRATTADKKLAITLWCLGDTSSMKITASLFGIHQSTLCNIAIEVCNVIRIQLGPKFIYLPKTGDEIMKTTAEFKINMGWQKL